MARADLAGRINPAGAMSGDHGGGSFRRILVPVDAFGHSSDALSLATSLSLAEAAMLRIVHVRIFDPPVRGSGRFYPQSSQEATDVLEKAAAIAWARGANSSGVVVDAQRALVAQAISDAGWDWNADLIVLARRSRVDHQPAASRQHRRSGHAAGNVPGPDSPARPPMTPQVAAAMTVTQFVSASPYGRALDAAVLAAFSPEVSSHVSH